MANVARLVERVMKRTHDLRGENIDRVLIPENPPFLADDEAEVLNVVRQIREAKTQRVIGRDVEVVKLEGLKIR